MGYFTTDERTANYLRQNAVKFEYCDSIAIKDLAPDWQQNNFGREKGIDTEAVLDYACRMEKGSSAPAVVVAQHTDGLSPCDGVQRLMSAIELGATQFAGYVLAKNTSKAKERLIRVAINGAVDGNHNPNPTFILATAVRLLHIIDGLSAQEIGHALGRRDEDVSAEIRYQKTIELMRSVGYDGKLCERSKKWFAATLGKYADVTDWQMAPGPIRVMLEKSEQCGFTNGTCEPLVEKFFDVKRTARKDRHEQFQYKLNEFIKSGEVQQRIKTDGKKTHVEKILSSLRASDTIIDKALSADEIIHDGVYAKDVANVLRHIWANLRKLVPHDLQYPDGARSSIFDRG